MAAEDNHLLGFLAALLVADSRISSHMREMKHRKLLE